MEKVALYQVRDQLVNLANDIGFSVDLNAETGKKNPFVSLLMNLSEGNKADKGPAGDCNYLKKHIRVRKGKGIEGQISTLIHELTHAMGMGGPSSYTSLGEDYIELVCESVTQFVTQMLGIDRTHKTAPRVYFGYGFKGFLVSPVTQAYINIFADYLSYDRPQLNQKNQMIKQIPSKNV